MTVKGHKLTHPMLYGWQVSNAPSDKKINLRYLQERLQQRVYDPYRLTDWFIRIDNDVAKIMRS